jgi:hypothetical protein
LNATGHVRSTDGGRGGRARTNLDQLILFAQRQEAHPHECERGSDASVARAGERSLFDAAGLTKYCADGWMQADNLSGAYQVSVDEPLR